MTSESSCNSGFTSDEFVCVLGTQEATDQPVTIDYSPLSSSRLADSFAFNAVVGGIYKYGHAESTQGRESHSDSMAGMSPLGSGKFLLENSGLPSQEEVVEYLDRHNFQAFLTYVVELVSSQLPGDPYDFIIEQICFIVAQFREKEKQPCHAAAHDRAFDRLDAQQPSSDMSIDQQEKIVLHIAAVLQSLDIARASATKMFHQFSHGSSKLTKEKFLHLLRHLERTWGLHHEDADFMMEFLKRWRFRTNASSGTLGLPLWPLLHDDFVKCFPNLLRAIRDKYMPISRAVDRARFIRQAAGSLEDKYEIGPKVGRGAYGEVMLVTHRITQERRVCKKVSHHQQRVSSEALPDEVGLLQRLDHPHIIRIFEYFESPEFLGMIMEPVFGGTLSKLVSALYKPLDNDQMTLRPDALTETWVGTVLFQMLGALTYAHSVVGLIHKDLKSDNILLVGKAGLCPEEILQQPIHAMLADFGIAEVLEPASAPNIGRGNSSSKVGGTPSYMSPEMFKGTFTEKCDIWSLGVVMFQLMSGNLPYRSRNLLAHVHAVCDTHHHPEWELLTRNRWTLGARLFCQLLLSKEEGMRPSAAEALKDNWLSKSADFSNALPSSAERLALQNQHLQSHLMHMARHCITSQLSLSPLYHLNQRFRQYDCDGNGRLSHLEMRQVLEDVGISSSEHMDLIIESLDGNRNGLIEYSEFVTGCLDLASEEMKSKLRAVFDVFDLDGSGAISVSELRQVLTQGANPDRQSSNGLSRKSNPMLDVLPDGTTVEAVMRDVDSNCTGQIEYEEFERYLLSEHEACGRRLAIAAPV